MRCPECGFDNPEGFAFCGRCGARLIAPLTEERRLVTVLFADVVGFTALSEHLDPEAVRQAMNLYFAAMSREVKRLEGSVEKYVGDAVLAVFGAPVAHEDDPERAVRAALAMHQALDRLRPQLAQLMGQGFQMRIGIHTGVVVAGEVYSRGQRDYVVTGDSVNLAARLQTAAPAGGILVSESTYRRTQAAFEFSAPQVIRVKGKRQPVTVYQVLGVRGERGASRGIAGLHAPMIGRDTELETIKAAYEKAVAERRPQALFILGEVGIGKSRLAREFLDWLSEAHPQAQVLQGSALSHSQTTSYLLLADLFRGYLKLRGSESSAQTYARLEEVLRALLPPHLTPIEFDYQLHSLAAVLGPRDTDDLLLAFPPEQRQKRIFLSLLRVLEVIAQKQPTVLVLDDLHWADEPSLAFLQRLISWRTAVPLLVVLIGRPMGGANEALTRLQGKMKELGYPLLSLHALSCRETRSLVDFLLPADPSIAPLVELAVMKSEGNPYFLEEIIRTYIEERVVAQKGNRWQAMRPLDDIRVPETIQGILSARIDRLNPWHKVTLQRAAIIGRNFWRNLLADLVDWDVDDELAVLEERELIHLLPTSRFEGDREYSFDHALLQEVAYNSVLHSTRRQVHRQIGQWLESHLAGRLEEVYDLLAHHYRLSDDYDKALEYLQRAGRRAQADYANREALAYYSQALAILDEMESAGRAYPEVRFEVLSRREGVYDVLAQRVPQEADIVAMVTLAQELQDEKRLIIAYNRRSLYYWKIGDYDHAEASAREALQLAQKNNDLPGQGMAHWNLGSALRWQGSPREALEHFRIAYELFEVGDLGAMAGRSLDRLASAYYDLGEYETALSSIQEALALHRRLGRRRDEAQALVRMGMMYADVLGDYSQALKCYQTALKIQQEIGDQWLLGTLTNDLGELLIRLGQLEAAEEHLQQAHAIWQEIQDAGGLFDNLSNYAALYLERGDADQAIVCLQEAVMLAPGPAQMADGIGRLAIAHLRRGRPGDLEHAGALIEEIQAIGEERQLSRGESLLWQAEIALATGHEGAALAYCMEAGRALGDSSYRREVLHWLTSQALQALGREDEAQVALERALAEVRRKAALITDEDMRTSFLERVSLNRRIMQQAGGMNAAT